MAPQPPTPPPLPPPPERSRPPLTPRQLAALDLRAHLDDPRRKQGFVTPMFELIAPRYDAFTRLFSFGMDARWKEELMRWLDGVAPARGTLLDVACGTGDLALAAARLRPGANVIGVDAASRMTALAAQRVLPGDMRRVSFVTGDLSRLALPDASVDAITGGYALRNVPDYRRGIAELARVLRPGGHLLTLDFYRPPSPVWRELFLGYLQLSGSAVGWWWHRAPVVYAYIAHSIRHFVTEAEFARALRAAGFDVRRESRFLLGGIALHHAVKR